MSATTCACGSRKKASSVACRTCHFARGQKAHGRDALTRFMEKVDRSGGPDACWSWVGRREANGYGRFYLNGRMGWAHRAAYLLLVGPIPDGHEVRHLVCDNPPCCNPAHLAVGTHMENVGDSVAKLRHTFGERNGSARLTEAQVRTIKDDIAAGRLHRVIAAEHGVSRSCVDMIGRGERWTHV